jgi:signal transduction histidine kinase
VAFCTLDWCTRSVDSRRRDETAELVELRRPPERTGAIRYLPPAAVASVGFLFPVSYLGYVSLNAAYLRGPVWLFPLGLALVLVLAVGLLYGGYWLAASEFTTDQGWLVTVWLFAGVVAAVALTFWPIFYQRVVGVAVADPIFILLVSAGLGANAGVVAGVSQVQSERRFRRVQETRDALVFLNRLLRHNVLNAVQIVRGNAELLLDDPDAAEVTRRARTIRRQSDRTDALVQNTRVLIRRVEGDVSREVVDLSAVVVDELETAREVYPHAVVEADVDPAVRVRADGLLSAVVSNLVRNAVVHSDRESPRVEVSVCTEDGSGVVRVADDGPGIPEAELAAIPDPGAHGDDGIGLYLVDELVSQYGGDVRFADNDPRGTVVRVELPRAE